MADASKKTTRAAKKSVAPKSSKVPTAKAVAAAAVAAETKGQPAPAAVKAAVVPPAKPAAAPAPAPAPVAAKPAAPAPAPAPAKPAAPAPAPAPAKPAAPAAAPKVTVISAAERQRMIEQAAYFRAEKHGFQGDSAAHWAAAEAEIDADLKRRGIKVA